MTAMRRVSILAGAAALLSLVATAPAFAVPYGGSSAYAVSSTVMTSDGPYALAPVVTTSVSRSAGISTDTDYLEGQSFGDPRVHVGRAETTSGYDGTKIWAESKIQNAYIVKEMIGFELSIGEISSWIDSDGNIRSSFTDLELVFGEYNVTLPGETTLGANTWLSELSDFKEFLPHGFNAVINEQGDGFVNAIRLTFDEFVFNSNLLVESGEIILAHAQLNPVPLPGAIGPMLLALSGFGVAGFGMRRRKKAA